MGYADFLSEAERKRGRRYGCCASLFGSISEVMLDSSAIIIIFFTMLDDGDFLAMFMTSFGGVVGTLFYIPACVFISRIGLKRTVWISCLTGFIGFMLIACSPFFGMKVAKYIALFGMLLYCIQRIAYGTAWYPLLDVFLRSQDRAKFFGTMRFLYTGLTGILTLIIGLIMRKYNPSILFLQCVIGGAGLLLFGRAYCVLRFPENKNEVAENPDIKKGLAISMKNGPLTAYSVYVGLYSMAFTSIIPLAYIYLNQYVQLNSGTVQIISSMGIGGLVAGFLCYSSKVGNLQLKYLELFSHCTSIFGAFVLFFADKSLPGFPLIVGIAIFAMTFGSSFFSCNNSAELLSLSRPGNKATAIAFVQTYGSGGTAIGRFGTSLILGSAMFSPVWNFYGREISRYQTFFLLYGVMLLILLFLLPTLPSFIPKHEDYYEPKK